MSERTPIRVWSVDDSFSTVQMKTEQGEFSLTVFDDGEVQLSTPNEDVSNIVVLDGYGNIHKLVDNG